MKLVSSSEKLKDCIDHYWVIAENNIKNPSLHAFPGINPELIIPLHGHFEFHYKKKKYSSSGPLLFAHIDESLKIDLSTLSSFVVVTFSSKGVSSLLPFTRIPSKALVKGSILPTCHIWENRIDILRTKLIGQDNEKTTDLLDECFEGLFNKKEGFVAEMCSDLKSIFSVNEILQLTGYSYSTLQRYVKKETGLTPSQFLKLKRFKSSLAHFYSTKSVDWMEYVCRFGYHDQSHFIHDFKRFTSFTPSLLSTTPCLLSHRPDLDFMTKIYNE